jgi:alanine dehydrogenase
MTAESSPSWTRSRSRYLARPDSAVLAVCGCGDQARAQACALVDVLPIERGFAWDIDPGRAIAYAAEMSTALGLPFQAVPTLREATRTADVIVTCTTARTAFLSESEVRPGTFVAAVGADNPDKSEITPALMARAKVVADVLGQCVVMGDLHHAIAAGAMTADAVHAELAEIVCGARPGRQSDGEIIVFDSTGTAIQDVASAAAIYDRALNSGIGGTIRLA